MALTIHVPEAETADRVAVVLSYDESPEHRGLVRRYTGLGSAALMIAFIFKGRGVRYAWRLLSDAERIAYQAERAAVNAGSGI